jgi:hypothetical protein
MRLIGRIGVLVTLLFLLALTIRAVVEPHILPFPLFGSKWLVRLVLVILIIWFYLWRDNGS